MSFQTSKLTNLSVLMASFNVEMENVLLRNFSVTNARIVLMGQMKMLAVLTLILTELQTVISANASCQIASAPQTALVSQEISILLKFLK